MHHREKTAPRCDAAVLPKRSVKVFVVSDSEEEFEIPKSKPAPKATKRVARSMEPSTMLNSDDESSATKKRRKAKAPVNIRCDEFFESPVRSSSQKAAQPKTQSSLEEVVMLGMFLCESLTILKLQF